MIELKSCCRVPFPEKLFEQYEILENQIFANVNASKIPEMMKRFIEEQAEPLFFILEIPAKYENENEIRPGVVDRLGTDVYYLDGLSKKNALTLLNSLGAFLSQDGMNTFGFAGHNTHEEFLFCPYNVTKIYTSTPEKFESLLQDFGIEKTENLITAWETFSEGNPGECWRLEEHGKTIYDIPSAFEKHGLYLYERRDDEGNPMSIRPKTLEELLGKTLLIGITFHDKEDAVIERKQYWGEVIEANDNFITIRQKNGETFNIPSDKNAIERAHPGEYKLKETGEVVKNPDYLSSWHVTKDH